MSVSAAPTSWRERVRSGPRYPQLLLVTCLLGMFSTTFTATILSVSLKSVAEDLGSTPSVIAWVITAPLLAQAVSMPILGRVGDIRGHRKVYLVGFALSVVGAVLTASAWDAASLITFRTFAQLAGSATVPATFAMLFRAFPPDERVKASAWASGVLSGASVTGLAVGGVLIDSIGWRSLFVIQAVLAVLALLLAVAVLAPDTQHEAVSLDKAGAVVLAIAVFSLAFGVNRAAAWGFHPIVFALAATFPLAVWVLIRVERAATSPLLPLRVVTGAGSRTAAGAAFLTSGSHMGSFIVTPLLLQGLFGYSATATSLITVSRTLAISLSAPIVGRVGVRLGERRTAVLGASSMAAAGLLLAVGASSTTIIVVVAAMVMSGFAFGHAQPSILALAGNSVEPDDFGVAVSLQQTSGQIGGVISMSLMTAIVGEATGATPYVAAYVLAASFAGSGGALLAGGKAGTRRRRRVR